MQFSEKNYIKTKIELDLLNICNLKCPYCYARKEYKNQKVCILNNQQLREIITQLKNIEGEFEFRLLGGEPTLNPNYKFVIRELQNNNNCKLIKLVTNGTKIISGLDPHKLQINFSFHPTQSNGDHILENLKRLKGFETVVHLLMVPSKLEEIKRFYEKAKPLSEVRHEFLIKNDVVSFIDGFFEDPKLYKDDLKEYTFKEAYNKSFLNWQCDLASYRIYANGDVYRMCIQQFLGNIFVKKINFNLAPIKCHKKFCHDDCLLSIRKNSHE